TRAGRRAVPAGIEGQQPEATVAEAVVDEPEVVASEQPAAELEDDRAVVRARQLVVELDLAIDQCVGHRVLLDRGPKSDLYEPGSQPEEAVLRIKYIIPFPFDDEGVANRAAQVPKEILGPGTEVDCVPVRNAGALLDSAYDALVFDMYVAEAGLRAEDEGFDA